jgi:hypothetical protein
MLKGDDVIDFCGVSLGHFRGDSASQRLSASGCIRVGGTASLPRNPLTIDNAKATYGALDHKRNGVCRVSLLSHPANLQGSFIPWCLANLKLVDLSSIHNSLNGDMA